MRKGVEDFSKTFTKNRMLSQGFWWWNYIVETKKKKRKEKRMTLVKHELVKIALEGEYKGAPGIFNEYASYPIASVMMMDGEVTAIDEADLERVTMEEVAGREFIVKISAETIEVDGPERKAKLFNDDGYIVNMGDYNIFVYKDYIEVMDVPVPTEPIPAPMPEGIDVVITAPDTQFQNLTGKYVKSLGNGTSIISIDGKEIVFGDDEFDTAEED